ncbi:hypothetical protein J27TS8_18480 [Robertmurraya siralis]|uniref:Uncharacterized protein n=1 Tax=Robertmurraya siralis TaxID=77777 RepID=A0A919WH61_9BACI|nr:acetyltransferase [Robertmurraya siralis]PAE19087.1 acetyltransferase [Bacillus sp. 7504-2]GIN61855.1 hypothetical protein J27TS8_18480 [Robertmurraya siralis]
MEEKVCPKCHSDQLKKGIIQSGNASVQMFSFTNPRGQSSSMTSLYCSHCGYVLGLYVENPRNVGK